VAGEGPESCYRIGGWEARRQLRAGSRGVKDAGLAGGKGGGKPPKAGRNSGEKTRFKTGVNPVEQSRSGCPNWH
jgi:hypothetical protein